MTVYRLEIVGNWGETQIFEFDTWEDAWEFYTIVDRVIKECILDLFISEPELM